MVQGSIRVMCIVSAGVSALGTAPVLAQDATVQLETITIEDDKPRANTHDRLLVRSTTSATKTETPILETPQSITVVTRKQLDEQSPQTVSDALRYTAGVLSDRDTNARYDSVFLRGFGAFGTSTSYVNYLDGLKLPRGQAFAQTSIDPFLLDRIDVIKGPASILYGQVSPGGLVNQVSRQPSSDPYNEVRIEGGSDGRLQAGLTSRGPLTADGKWQYSFSALGRTAGTRYEDVDEKRISIAPALKWQPDADTSLLISGYYQRDPEGGYFNSLYPRFLAPVGYSGALNRKLNIGDPTFDAFEREQYGIGYKFEHRFNDLVTIRSNFRYSHVDVDFQSLQMSAPLAAGLIPRHSLRSIEDVDGVAFDNQAQFNFNTGAISHTMLAGVDHQYSTSGWQYRMGAATPLNIVNPHYGLPIGPLATAIDSDQTIAQTGIYLQDQLKFGGFHALLGIRHDWTRQETDNRLALSHASQDSDKTSYRAGLLYLFDNGLAPYASYSTSFEPTIGVGVNGAAFAPTEGEQYEVGIKYQPSNMDVLLTFSAFDIRQKNVLTPSIVPGFSVQQGEIRSRGLEFEARGNVTKNIGVIAAMTLLDTEVTQSSDPSIIGKRPQAVPNHFGSLWGSYTVDEGALAGLTIAGGLRFVGASYADDANTVKAGGYTLVDAALRYDFSVKTPALKGLEATLNVTNLLDKDYYSSCSSNFYCQFGNGRQVLAGLRYKW